MWLAERERESNGERGKGRERKGEEDRELGELMLLGGGGGGGNIRMDKGRIGKWKGKWNGKEKGEREKQKVGFLGIVEKKAERLFLFGVFLSFGS